MMLNRCGNCMHPCFVPDVGGGNFKYFIIQYDVSFSFFLDTVYHIKDVLFTDFYFFMNRIWNFFKCVYCFRDDYVIFFLPFLVNVMNYIDLFSDIKLILYSQDNLPAHGVLSFKCCWFHFFNFLYSPQNYYFILQVRCRNLVTTQVPLSSPFMLYFFKVLHQTVL